MSKRCDQGGDVVGSTKTEPQPTANTQTGADTPSSLRVLSLGAGVQSTTLALMAAHGEIEPCDCAIFADTQAEPAYVYKHLEWLKGQLPFPVHVVSTGSLEASSLQPRKSRKTGNSYLKTAIPVHVLLPHGGQGTLGRSCTGDYKITPIIRKTRELIGGESAIRAARKCGALPLVEQWIGISTDEASRMKPSQNDWIRLRWPLIERGLSRGECLRWLEKRNFPQPGKSSCVFCPYHGDRTWRELKLQHPHEFERAVAFERQFQKRSAEHAVLRGIPYLHSNCRPLDEINFTDQLDLFENECEGMCGV